MDRNEKVLRWLLVMAMIDADKTDTAEDMANAMAVVNFYQAQLDEYLEKKKVRDDMQALIDSVDIDKIEE